MWGMQAQTCSSVHVPTDLGLTDTQFTLYVYTHRHPGSVGRCNKKGESDTGVTPAPPPVTHL